ncbi:hypothetical protein GQ600_14642 [Phytophthora cactorum]|nr:hypothetical protein GQ600_14642 [Phytophthora cactorum]
MLRQQIKDNCLLSPTKESLLILQTQPKIRTSTSGRWLFSLCGSFQRVLRCNLHAIGEIAGYEIDYHSDRQSFHCHRSSCHL